MDVLDESDLWDPSSIFDENSEQNNQVLQNREKEEEEEEERQLDELGTMFFEWLKNNKEHISAEDMRSIKIKRSTVESASKRLGSSKEGKKQLLKLILEWVEKYQLQKKTNGETLPSTQFLDPLHNPTPNLTDPNPSFPPPPSWIPPPPPPPPYDPTAGFYIEDSYSNITNFQNYPPPHTQPTPPVSADYRQMMEPGTNSWPPSQFMMTYNQFPDTPDTINPNSVGFYSDQYPYPYQHQVFGENGERLGSSATKEARKKRMARQRRSQ